MSARTILVTIGLSAWLLASAVVFLIVSYTTFFGIAVIGLAICYVSTRFELDEDTSFLATRLQGGRDLPEEQRLAARHEQSLANQSARFFKLFGLGLAVIGLCGGLYYQL
ncbi:MAG: hypothetical protein EPO10_19620 [Reyranella sp.]|uniref:hypothetical protein n=1 Tax=Reyranella sp. TaxID=1929291 RepID=UPI0011FCD5B3|nr:hypothetical protein [Reyranella sp.]TAJ87209.1 MAG: hypothetical protein EPO41_22985 [Reyranella sp.]TBR27144.1 MAG: hypothetical protein EPO10_19620 [Reyranella sp.]